MIRVWRRWRNAVRLQRDRESSPFLCSCCGVNLWEQAEGHRELLHAAASRFCETCSLTVGICCQVTLAEWALNDLKVYLVGLLPIGRKARRAVASYFQLEFLPFVGKF